MSFRGGTFIAIRMGVVMNVVTSAMITMMVNSGGDRIPRSRPAFRITSSTKPRVFIRTPRPSESSQFIPVALPVMAGREALVWGDVLSASPDLLASVPQGVTVCEWGYEDDHPFGARAEGR